MDTGDVESSYFGELPSWCFDREFEGYWQHRREVENMFESFSLGNHQPGASYDFHPRIPPVSSRDCDCCVGSEPQDGDGSLSNFYYNATMYWKHRYHSLLAREERRRSSVVAEDAHSSCQYEALPHFPVMSPRTTKTTNGALRHFPTMSPRTTKTTNGNRRSCSHFSPVSAHSSGAEAVGLSGFKKRAKHRRKKQRMQATLEGSGLSFTYSQDSDSLLYSGKTRKSEGRRGSSRVDAHECGHYGGNEIVFDVDSQLLKDSNDEGEIIECHMQITDEMLDFFAQSALHRMQRDEQKKLEAEKEKQKENKIIDISQAGKGSAVATTAAPVERPGQKRTAEMKLLYGKGAAMIHGMETAMQLNFDRNLDLKQPKHWPHLPLNIMFAN